MFVAQRPMETCEFSTQTSLSLIFASCCLVPNQVSWVLSGLSFSRFVDILSSIIIAKKDQQFFFKSFLQN